MIELKNITIEALKVEDFGIMFLLQNENAKTLEDVVRIMEKYPDYDWEDIIEEIEKIEKYLKLANDVGDDTEIYDTEGYKDPSLLKQDSLNYGNVLLLDSPTDHFVKYYYLKNKTIEEIKKEISMTNIYGHNYLCLKNRKIGPNSLPKIHLAIEMFEKQIERQSKLTSEREINLFTLDYNLKTEIVNDLYAEIIMYLIYNTNEKLVWSNLSDNQKRLYMSSVINSKVSDIETKKNIMGYIANYTTLPELEKMAKSDFKVLKRFIIK